MMRGRLRRRGQEEDPAPAGPDYILDPSDLSGIFHVPNWLCDLDTARTISQGNVKLVRDTA